MVICVYKHIRYLVMSWIVGLCHLWIITFLTWWLSFMSKTTNINLLVVLQDQPGVCTKYCGCASGRLVRYFTGRLKLWITGVATRKVKGSSSGQYECLLQIWLQSVQTSWRYFSKTPKMSTCWWRSRKGESRLDHPLGTMNDMSEADNPHVP